MWLCQTLLATKGGEDVIQNTVTAILLALVFAISAPAGVYAQSNTDPNTNYTAPQGGTTTTTDDDPGFNWWWLLPLAAIPFVYLATRGSDDTYEETRRERYAMGAKGGRSETPRQGWTRDAVREEEYDE